MIRYTKGQTDEAKDLTRKCSGSLCEGPEEIFTKQLWMIEL